MTFQFSICIPRIFNNISNKRIVSTFENLNLGLVGNMNIVWKTNNNGVNYKMAFIHFDKWNDSSEAAVNLRKKIENPKVEARLVYDDPWYWVILPNNSPPYMNDKSQLQSHNPIVNQQMMENCLSRILHLENELHSVYEELYQREYIPDKYRIQQDEWSINSPFINSNNTNDIAPYYDDYSIVSSSSTHMSRELDNLSLSTLQNEDTMEYLYDTEPLHKPSSFNNLNESLKINKQHQPKNIKQWMTINYCGNE